MGSSSHVHLLVPFVPTGYFLHVSVAQKVVLRCLFDEFCYNLFPNFNLLVMLAHSCHHFLDRYFELSEKYHYNLKLDIFFIAFWCQILSSTSQSNILPLGIVIRKVDIILWRVDIMIVFSANNVDLPDTISSCKIIVLLSVWHFLDKNPFLKFIF